MEKMSPNNPPLTSDEWSKTPAKKDRKKWCGGHEGRLHTPILRWSRDYKGEELVCRRVTGLAPWQQRYYSRHGPWVCYHEEVCKTCGKILQWRIDPENCPTRPADVV